MSQNGLAFVLNADTRTFAGFLFLGGRAADIWSRRRLFLIGVTLFAAMSLLGGLAQPDGDCLFVARRGDSSLTARCRCRRRPRDVSVIG
jgi:MFS family permease